MDAVADLWRAKTTCAVMCQDGDWSVGQRVNWAFPKAWTGERVGVGRLMIFVGVASVGLTADSVITTTTLISR